MLPEVTSSTVMSGPTLSWTFSGAVSQDSPFSSFYRPGHTGYPGCARSTGRLGDGYGYVPVLDISLSDTLW